MRIGRLAGFAALAALASLSFWAADLKAGWGAPFACGAGPNTLKLEWDDSQEVPTESSRAVATGDSVKPTEPTVDELDVDLEALAKMKPLLVYYYVDPISDPMDENYKFSRKFELGVLGESVNEVLAKGFRLKKVSLPADADMKKVENQARIEFWSPTNKKVRSITRAEDAMLNKSPFLVAVKSSIAKSDKLVKDEVARITKLRLERDKKAKEAEQKAKEPETAKN